MPFCPPFHSTAPSSVPDFTPEMGMERRKLHCCLHRDVTLSTKLSHFSSESHCATAGCAVAADLTLSRCDVPGFDPGCVQVPVPGRVLATALATQLPYKPWNVPASPAPLALGQLARTLLLKGQLCLWHRVLCEDLPLARAGHCPPAPEGTDLHSIPAWSTGPEGIV